jgi:hypothetical protein
MTSVVYNSSAKSKLKILFGEVAPHRALVVETVTDTAAVAWVESSTSGVRVPISDIPELYVISSDSHPAKAIDNRHYLLDQNQSYKVTYAGIQVASIESHRSHVVTAKNGARVA